MIRIRDAEAAGSNPAFPTAGYELATSKLDSGEPIGVALRQRTMERSGLYWLYWPGSFLKLWLR